MNSSRQSQFVKVVFAATLCFSMSATIAHGQDVSGVSFNLNDSSPSVPYDTIQEQASPSDQVKDQAETEVEEKKRSEKSIDELLPKVDLNAGISPNSMQRTLVNREISDLNYSFLETAHYAPDFNADDPAWFWKTWTSPNMVHRQLYFEEANLERYGIHRHMQPAVSGTHFLANVVMLPLKGITRRPNRCDYSLGYYRPGNCNPAFCNPLFYR